MSRNCVITLVLLLQLRGHHARNGEQCRICGAVSPFRKAALAIVGNKPA
jgi:hypothetical protein